MLILTTHIFLDVFPLLSHLHQTQHACLQSLTVVFLVNVKVKDDLNVYFLIKEDVKALL